MLCLSVRACPQHPVLVTGLQFSSPVCLGGKVSTLRGGGCKPPSAAPSPPQPPGCSPDLLPSLYSTAPMGSTAEARCASSPSCGWAQAGPSCPSPWPCARCSLPCCSLCTQAPFATPLLASFRWLPVACRTECEAFLDARPLYTGLSALGIPTAAPPILGWGAHRSFSASLTSQRNSGWNTPPFLLCPEAVSCPLQPAHSSPTSQRIRTRVTSVSMLEFASAEGRAQILSFPTSCRAPRTYFKSWHEVGTQVSVGE